MRRLLDSQERAQAGFRTRAGVVLSAAAIVTSFLGGQALTAHGFTTLAWLAIAAFAVLGITALCVLWPDDRWEFEAVPTQLLATYAERADGARAPVYVTHRELALHMERSYTHNELRRLRWMRWAFRTAVVAVASSLWLPRTQALTRSSPSPRRRSLGRRRCRSRSSSRRSAARRLLLRLSAAN